MKYQLIFLTIFSFVCSNTLRADVVNLAGDTTGAPTFVRPTETGARSFFTAHYDVYQFNVATSGQFTFTLNAADPANYDTYLHLFAGAFNPSDLSDPAANFLAANDDKVFNNPALGSGLSNLQLNAGTNYYLVIDGFSPSDFGAFTASISGPGAITVVPEPTPTALVILAGAIGGVVMRNRLFRSRRS